MLRQVSNYVEWDFDSFDAYIVAERKPTLMHPGI